MLADLCDPDDILDDLWQRLANATVDAHNPFRTASLCSLRNDGSPDARSVVLRHADRATREIVFHTDRRSEKCEQLARDARSACLFYDPAEKLQLRVRTNATLHSDDAIADTQWQNLPDRNRLVYATSFAPGTVLDTFGTPTLTAASAGRSNFSVIRCVVMSIDWLYLHPDGHRRMRFDGLNETMSGKWIAP